MFIVNWLLLSQQLADDSSSFMSWSQDNHPFHSWLSFSLSIPCWNSDPQNFQTAKTKSKDTWEKVTQREEHHSGTSLPGWIEWPKLQTNPNTLLSIVKDFKNHKPGSLHKQSEEFHCKWVCLHMHVYTCKVVPNGWTVRQDFSSVEQLFGFSKTTSGSRFWQFWTSENIKFGCLKV
jgi:hypothetical protein